MPLQREGQGEKLRILNGQMLDTTSNSSIKIDCGSLKKLACLDSKAKPLLGRTSTPPTPK